MWRIRVFFCLFVTLVVPAKSNIWDIFSTDVKEKWIEQPLDHFDVRNNRTWQMRFYENDQFFNESGPIFILLGGEVGIGPNNIQYGTIFENAKVHRAMMYHTEHRYYGNSRPVPDTSLENLRYLSVDQALADVAFFIETKKRELNIPNAQVIVFGCSYAGNMAAWIRIKYPHLIQGALASSAPVHVKADFFEFNEVLTNSLRNYDEKCLWNIKEAISKVESLLFGDNPDPEKIKNDFNFCDVPDTTHSRDLRHVIHATAMMISDVVQFNKIEDGNKTSIAKLCDSLTPDSSNETPYDRLVTVFQRQYPWGCQRLLNYNTSVDIFREISWDSFWETSMIKPWYYQACTEFGYHRTSNSTDSIFGSLLPLEYFVQMCKDFFFGEEYSTDILHEHVRRTNEKYGSNSPNVTNVIFTNGDVDPWRQLSVQSDLNEHSPSILIKGASHCEDLYGMSGADSEDMKKAQKKIAGIIAQWLNEK